MASARRRKLPAASLSGAVGVTVTASEIAPCRQ